METCKMFQTTSQFSFASENHRPVGLAAWNPMKYPSPPTFGILWDARAQLRYYQEEDVLMYMCTCIDI